MVIPNGRWYEISREGEAAQRQAGGSHWRFPVGMQGLLRLGCAPP